MRNNLPICKFDKCRYYLDGACTNKTVYLKCKYRKAVRTLESIMGTQKFCVLCENLSCKNSITQDAICKPQWDGAEI